MVVVLAKWIWINLIGMNVYVNVTYECCSQSKYEKSCEMIVYVNVTYECCSQSEYE
jgi:hypothetical protein